MGSKQAHKKQQVQGSGGPESLSGKDDWDLPLLDDEDYFDDEDDSRHKDKKSGKRFHRKWTQKDSIGDD